MKVRYNNGKSKSDGTEAMIITIPAFVVRDLGLKHGDKMKVIPVKENNTIIIKPFIGESAKE